MYSDSIYIIAEAGVNHNGNIDLAKELVKQGLIASSSRHSRLNRSQLPPHPKPVTSLKSLTEKSRSWRCSRNSSWILMPTGN